ncbi:uncharacterized protein LOC125675575 isoform X2 [Ostrea edulis]|nr:uncharacterized protein LOC125675575 isoform X2 [Ostrea edulis]
MKVCIVFLVLSLCCVTLGVDPGDWAYFYLNTACSMMKKAKSNFFTGDAKVIAFQARASKRLVNIPKHHVVKFGHVITNKGNGYRARTGKFSLHR